MFSPETRSPCLLRSRLLHRAARRRPPGPEDVHECDGWPLADAIRVGRVVSERGALGEYGYVALRRLVVGQVVRFPVASSRNPDHVVPRSERVLKTVPTAWGSVHGSFRRSRVHAAAVGAHVCLFVYSEVGRMKKNALGGGHLPPSEPDTCRPPTLVDIAFRFLW